MSIQPLGQNQIYNVGQNKQVSANPALPQTQETEQQAGNTAPYDLMQAKQGLDQREDIYKEILGGQTEQMTNQQLYNNAVQAQKDMELDSKGSDITDKELQAIFGDKAGSVRELLNKRSDVKLSDLAKLRNDSAGLDEVIKQLTQKTDLQFSDVVNVDKNGKVSVDKSLTDDECKELMNERNDIKPKELTNLRAQLVKALGNPVMAKKAFSMAVKLLKVRKDVKPEAVGDMFTKISEQMNSIAPPGGAKGAAAAGAKLEMMETAVDLMIKRNDINTDQVTKLTEGIVKTMGDKNDGMSMNRVARSFRDAADLLVARPDMSVESCTKFLGSLKRAVPGKDPNALDNRASMFSNACNMLKANPGMNFDNVEELLKRQTQGKNPKKGNNLMKDFNEGIDKMGKGSNIDDIAPPVNKNDQKKTDKTEKTDKNDKTDKTDKTDEKGKKAETGKPDSKDEADEAGKPGEEKGVKGKNEEEAPGAAEQQGAPAPEKPAM